MPRSVIQLVLVLKNSVDCGVNEVFITENNVGIAGKMIMKLVKTMWPFLVMVSFYGCTTMSQKECLSSDWYAVGYDDGYRGYTAVQFSKHHKACAKHGVTADFQAYQSGREQGLLVFCKPERAFQIGKQGKSYQGVCPETVEQEFLSAYHAGNRLYKIKAEINSIQSEIRTSQKELDEINLELESKSEHLVSEGLSVLQRGQLLKDILELTETYELLEDEIHNLEHEKSSLERQYANYQISRQNVY